MIRSRYYCLLLLFLWVALPVGAQQKLKFAIASFDYDPFDSTPTNKKYEKIDGSGSRYAIVKVTSDLPDDDLGAYVFNFGNLRHIVEKHDGELWVYVQRNAKMVTISREGYSTINKYDLGMTIESGKTYVMRLQVQAAKVQHRILQFQISPADGKALVKVKREGDKGDYELWGTVDETGNIARRLETGIYLYEVVAEHYDPSEGRIILMNADSNYVERVTLRPNFGYLQVDDEQGIAGAEIYVNDRKIGTVPYTSKERWDARDDYRIMVTKGELYTQTKYCNSSSYGYNGFTDNLRELELTDDAAYVNWGSNWRMPSSDQFNELINSSNTTTKWTTQNGVYGLKITSKSNGESIFLPAAGNRYDTSLGNASSYGDYWSRSLGTNRASKK